MKQMSMHLSTQNKKAKKNKEFTKEEISIILEEIATGSGKTGIKRVFTSYQIQNLIIFT